VSAGVLAVPYAELLRESDRLDALLNDSSKPLNDRRRYFAPYTQVQQELKRRNDAALIGEALT
jgi:hypothetical protein